MEVKIRKRLKKVLRVKEMKRNMRREEKGLG